MVGTKSVMLGASLSAIVVIGILAIALTMIPQEDDSSAQKIIQESIQNEISRYPKITGIHAQNICIILDLECSSEKSFPAMYDSSDGYTKLTYSKEHVDYFFRINDNELVYKTSLQPAIWKIFDESWSEDVDYLKPVSSQLITYAYDDICEFPITDQMRLDLIYDASHDFTNDGLSFIKLRGWEFTHIELAQYYEHLYPSLNYWYTLKNGQQVYFKIGVCDLLDIANCHRMAEYYTKLQSPTMFTHKNTDFDPMWKDQVFPIMDYCIKNGTFKMDIVDEKVEWSFYV